MMLCDGMNKLLRWRRQPIKHNIDFCRKFRDMIQWRMKG
jgi:hypothetical protein